MAVSLKCKEGIKVSLSILLFSFGVQYSNGSQPFCAQDPFVNLEDLSQPRDCPHQKHPQT